MIDEARVEVLWEACREGDAAKVEQLFEKGLTLREAREINNAALCIACEEGHVEVVRMLFEKGLTLRDARSRKSRPLRWACMGGHVEVARLLFEKGLKAEDARECDNFALRWACMGGHVEVVRVLFEEGLGAVDARECDALRAAYENEHEVIVALLWHMGPTREDFGEAGVLLPRWSMVAEHAEDDGEGEEVVAARPLRVRQ